MRTTIADLPTPFPLHEQLPSVYRDLQQAETGVAEAFLEAVDLMLAPVFSVLDSLDSYVDPFLAPLDFVATIASWVGLELDENWPPERQRSLAAAATDLFSRRGTRLGLARELAIYADAMPDIVDSGSCVVLDAPDDPIPGDRDAWLWIQWPDGAAAGLDEERISTIIRRAKPAHVELRQEEAP